MSSAEYLLQEAIVQQLCVCINAVTMLVTHRLLPLGQRLVIVACHDLLWRAGDARIADQLVGRTAEVRAWQGAQHPSLKPVDRF